MMEMKNMKNNSTFVEKERGNPGRKKIKTSKRDTTHCSVNKKG